MSCPILMQSCVYLGTALLVLHCKHEDSHVLSDPDVVLCVLGDGTACIALQIRRPPMSLQSMWTRRLCTMKVLHRTRGWRHTPCSSQSTAQGRVGTHAVRISTGMRRNFAEATHAVRLHTCRP